MNNSIELNAFATVRSFERTGTVEVTKAYLALVEEDVVSSSLSTLSGQLEIIVGLEYDRAVVILRAGIIVRQRVLAVVRHVLVRRGAQQLQEGQLDAVDLVRELKMDRCQFSSVVLNVGDIAPHWAIGTRRGGSNGRG